MSSTVPPATPSALPAPPPTARPSLLQRVAGVSYRRRRLVLLAWVVALVGMSLLGSRAGGSYATNFRFPDNQSQRAADLLVERFPARSGDTVQIVFRAPGGIDAVRPAMTALFGTVAGLEHVRGVSTPYDVDAPGQVSADRRTAIAVVQLDVASQELPSATASRMIDAVRGAAAADGPGGLEVAASGQAILQAEAPPTGPSGLVGLFAAVVILLVAFGSVVAMGLPVVTAVFGLTIGLAVLELTTRLLDVPNWAPQLAGLLALGVGVDYALFIVTRYRQGLQAGLGVPDAIGRAMDTAGRAVLFAGVTVVISVLGIFTMGFPILNGVAVGTAAAVAMTMLAALTLLPALLGFAGRRVDALALPWLRRGRPASDAGGASRLGVAWARLVQRRRWAFAAGGLAIALALAAPVLSLRLGFPDDGTNPPSYTTRQAYDMVTAGFGPGTNGPLLVAVRLDGADAARALEPIRSAAAADPDVAAVTPPVLNEQRSAAVMTVVPETGPQDEATVDLITRLRSTLPAAAAGSGAAVDIGGAQATSADLSDAVAARLPVFIGVVVGLAFLMLVVVFRSMVIALTAAVMNLLSVGAAYGVVVATFQWGWGQGILGVDGTVPIPSFVLMLMFAVLFGLSMDYEVFLLSRIKEEHARTGDTSRAVASGLGSTARIITAAAAIMVAVFGAFILNDVLFLKLFGVGLAAAVLIDATLIRLVVVPAVMAILGEANWWMPHGLARILPDLRIEGGDGHEHSRLPGRPVIAPPALGAPGA